MHRGLKYFVRGTQNGAQTRTYARYRKQHRSIRPIFNTNFRNSKQNSVWSKLETWGTNAWKRYLSAQKHEMLSCGGDAQLQKWAPICVGVATTKCNALRKVGKMNLVERKGPCRTVGRGSLLSLGNWIHCRTQPPVFTPNSESRHIVRGTSQ